MKYRWDKKYLYWGLTAFLVLVSAVLFFFAVFRLDSIVSGIGTIFSILMPLIYGFVIAYLLSPAVNFFDRHLEKITRKICKKPQEGAGVSKQTRVFSVLITVLLAVLVVVALFYMIIPQLISSVAGFIESVPKYLDNFQVQVGRLLEDNPTYRTTADNIIKSLSTNFDQLYDRVKDLLPSVNNILTGVTVGVMGVVNVVKNVGVGIIVSIYLLYSKEVFGAQCKKTLYALCETKHANSILNTTRHTHKVFSNFIIGKLLDSLIIGILCFICMSLFRMPLPLLISVIIGVTNIVPFFGPFIGAIPSALIILLVDPKSCIGFIIFILVLQQFDGNILGPKILGESTGLSSFWVIFAILVGGGLFGFVGMVVGVPFFAVIYIACRMAIEKSLKNKGLSEDTHDYVELESVEIKKKASVGSESDS